MQGIPLHKFRPSGRDNIDFLDVTLWSLGGKLSLTGLNFFGASCNINALLLVASAYLPLSARPWLPKPYESQYCVDYAHLSRLPVAALPTQSEHSASILPE